MIVSRGYLFLALNFIFVCVWCSLARRRRSRLFGAYTFFLGGGEAARLSGQKFQVSEVKNTGVAGTVSVLLYGYSKLESILSCSLNLIRIMSFSRFSNVLFLGEGNEPGTISIIF